MNLDLFERVMAGSLDATSRDHGEQRKYLPDTALATTSC
jgi:hypothetical protein